MSTSRSPDLTERVQKEISKKPEPRRVFALQFLEARHRQGDLPETAFKDLSNMVRNITSICRRLFHGSWADVDGQYDVISELSFHILEASCRWSNYAVTQVKRALKVRDGLPGLDVDSAVGLLERLKQWEGSLRPLYQPDKDSAVMFAHIGAHFLDVIWLPFLQYIREHPEHPMCELIEAFDVLNDNMIRFQRTNRKAYKVMREICTYFERGCAKLDAMGEQETIADMYRNSASQPEWRDLDPHAQQQHERQAFTAASAENAQRGNVEHRGIPASLGEFRSHTEPGSTADVDGQGELRCQAQDESDDRLRKCQSSVDMRRFTAQNQHQALPLQKQDSHQAAALSTTTPPAGNEVDPQTFLDPPSTPHSGRRRQSSQFGRPRPLNILEML